MTNEYCDRCGGKIVRVKDGSTCACGAFSTRRAVAVGQITSTLRYPMTARAQRTSRGVVSGGGL